MYVLGVSRDFLLLKKKQNACKVFLCVYMYVRGREIAVDRLRQRI